MPSSFTLLKKSLSVFTENPERYATLIAIPAALTFLVSFFTPNIDVPEPDMQMLITVILLSLVSIVISVVMTIAAIFAIADKSVTITDAYQKAKNYFFKYLLLTIVMTAILFGAFLLLIIPGIWLSVCFSFAMYFLLLNGSGVRQSLRESKALVKGKWWSVATKMFILSLVCLLIYILIEFVTSVLGGLLAIESITTALSAALGVFVTPFALVYTYELFVALQTNVTNATSEVVPTAPELSV